MFTLGHIPSRPSPFRAGVDDETWITIDLIVVGCSQLAALAYLATVLVVCRPGCLARNLGQAFLVQAGLLVPFAVVGVLVTTSAMQQMFPVNIMPSALETRLAIRPDLTGPVTLAMLGTFLLFWGIMRLVLFAFPWVASKRAVSLVHTLVMHPLAFPLSWLVGLIHAVYYVRTVRHQHCHDDVQ